MNKIPVHLRPWLVAALVLSAPPAASSQQQGGRENPALAIPFTGKYGQVEAGGPYAGAEFHGSRPLPSRVSFYSPVANSIDLSTDYWKRGESRPFVLAARVDKGKPRYIGKEGWDYVVSPHRAEFHRAEEGIRYVIRYDFCGTLPAMVMRITAVNAGPARRSLTLYTHALLALRSCQTYARFDSAIVRIADSGRALVASYSQPQLAMPSLIVLQRGARPVHVWTDAAALGVRDSGGSAWVDRPDRPLPAGVPTTVPHRALAAASFARALAPGDSLTIVQVFASCRLEQVEELLDNGPPVWEADVAAFDRTVGQAAHLGIQTGSPDLDSSAIYARGILEANQHYIDGVIEPMPCPAEYNFFFTHDVLLTGLATSLFDPVRVARDLRYIILHASGDTIPHAYYWRDNGFKTELCTPDNWNHLWFVLLNGWYLRHSGDSATAGEMYPYVTRSLTEILSQRGRDGLMHAFRPDWWDIGRSEGPRSFITILTIRALEEYCALSTVLGRNLEKLGGYMETARAMRQLLVERLWDPTLGYLVNYNGTAEDRHLYMGSLLAPAFRQLAPDTARVLLRTASRSLLAPQVGIRTVYPVDFNTPEAIKFFKFVGNEAGDPYVYANGGVWQHCNAWYAVGLQQNGMADSALAFYRRTMTIGGVLHSPMGQPAMYEYRYSDPSSPRYGAIDKPSFLWAGGFSLFTLYHLLGVRDNPWNISLGNSLPRDLHETAFTLAFGDSMRVVQHGTGAFVGRVRIKGAGIPSRVLPLDLQGAGSAEVFLENRSTGPVIDELFAILHHVSYDERTHVLSADVQGFKGQQVVLRGSAPGAPRRALREDDTPVDVHHAVETGGTRWELTFPASGAIETIRIEFP